METVIDWSKAPSWATSVGKCYGSLAWISEAGYCFQEINNPPCHPYKAGEYAQDRFIVVARRPLPWTGEGLPPVGTVCERCTHSDVYDGRHEEVKILAHTSKGFPVWENTDGTFAGIAKEEFFIPGMPAFRPLRTQDQIAAVERQRAIYDAMNEAKVNWEEIEKGPIGLVLEVIVSQLYDAGYRLQVQP